MAARSHNSFVVNKDGYYYSVLAPKQAREFPGMIFTGENNLEVRKNILKGIFTMHRRAGALWSFAEEPNNGPLIGETKKLSTIFFDEVISLRIISKIENKKSDLLNPVRSDSG